MADHCDSELYRDKAAEMRQQAARADTPYLRAMYESIANNWDLHADAMEEPILPPPPPAELSPDRDDASNWSSLI